MLYKYKFKLKKFWFLMGMIGLMIPAMAVGAGIQVKAVLDDGTQKTLQLYSNYHALVVGCEDYKTGWPKLEDRVAETQEIANMLKDMGWSVETLDNPNGQTLRRAIQKLVFNQGKDREKGIMIWFSGHGYTMQEADGTGLGYLVPVDAGDPGLDPLGFSEKAFSLRDMETVARQIMAKHVLMVFDAPLAGDLFLMQKPEEQFEIKPKSTAPARQIIIGHPPGIVYRGKSALKKLFLQGLGKHIADLNNDGYITGSELGFYVSNNLAKSEQQKSIYYGIIDNPKLNQGDFVVALPKPDTQKSKEKAIAGEKRKKKISNELGMTFNYIPPGEFMMGSPKNEPGRDDDETQHKVTLTRGYYMQTTEVTQGQWKKVMGHNPSNFPQCGDDCPVENINWEDVQVFIQRLNHQDGHGRYRLPTEAEWEYACRAGTDTATYAGEMKIIGERNAPILDDIAWYGGNSCADYPGARNCSNWRQRQYQCTTCGTQEVGLKEPNAFGLHDMLGNVYEWCQDYFAKFPQTAMTDPKGPIQGTRRIARGGAFDYHARSCRSANRNHFFPRNRNSYVGFRLVMEPVGSGK